MEGGQSIDLAGYLARISVVEGDLKADAETLRRLQERHLLSIPFENLDIHWKRPISLDLGRFYDKIVEEKRGGFCYELNGLFNELLKRLKFQTKLVSARVFNGAGHGPDFDHAAIIVTIGGERYLADVGFGDFAAGPLRFAPGEEQKDPAGTFKIAVFDEEHFEVAKLVDGAWMSEYIFRDKGRDLSEFAKMCDFQQYSPESHFTKGKVCSLMTPGGRKTLTDTKFIVTANGIKTETAVSSETEFDEILWREFGIRQN